MEGQGRSRKIKEGHGWSFPITRLTFQGRKVTGGVVVVVVACKIIVSAPVPFLFLWTLDFNFLDLNMWLGFGTWNWTWAWQLCNCLKWMLQNWCNVTGIIANGRNKSQDIKYHRKETWTENFLQIIDFTAYKNGWRVEVTLRNPEPREKLPSPLDNDQWQPPLQWYKPWCFPLNIYIWWAAWVYDQ